jgi:adenosine deaminase
MTTTHQQNSPADPPTKIWPALILLLLFIIVPIALTHAGNGDPNFAVPQTTAEARTTRAFELARGLGDARLYAFLHNMPKGGDLHNHLTGAVYAETFIREAAADNLCVDTATLTLAANKNTCTAAQFPASKALTDETTWDNLINALSDRSYVPHTGYSEHDQFFSTFNRFGALDIAKHGGEWVDEIVTRAASQNEQYVELMDVAAVPAMFGLAAKIHIAGTTDADLADAKRQAEAAGLTSVIAAASAEMATMDAQRNAIEHCGTPQAAPGCTVTVRWIDSVIRDLSAEQVFIQTLVAFETTKINPTVVGINYLRAEDWRGSLDQYAIGMRFVQWLRPQYPAAHLSLHAGELTLGVVPPEYLRDHIRQAVEIAGAERIGHGVDVGYETDSTGLLREMAQKNIMVEINLTSNDAILGVKGEEHPLSAYMAAHVPVALSTDDEGVSRIDITHEYVKGVEEQGLDYRDLKRMARTSIEHAFLPGPSLWSSPTKSTRFIQMFNVRNSACSDPITATALPPGPCRDFLNTSPRAAQQYELERRFADFEAHIR